MIVGTLSNMTESTKTEVIEPKNTLSEDIIDILTAQRKLDEMLKDTLAIMLGNRLSDFEVEEPTCHLDGIETIKKLSQNNVQLIFELNDVLK